MRRNSICRAEKILRKYKSLATRERLLPFDSHLLRSFPSVQSNMSAAVEWTEFCANWIKILLLLQLDETPNYRVLDERSNNQLSQARCTLREAHVPRERGCRVTVTVSRVVNVPAKMDQKESALDEAAEVDGVTSFPAAAGSEKNSDISLFHAFLSYGEINVAGVSATIKI